ncbi:MAG: hypothetical protein ACE149_02080 [Armatimonadota bacterium]
MAGSARIVFLLVLLLTVGLVIGPLCADTLVYDSSADDFAGWQTNHPSKLYWDPSAEAYHYALTDAANDYAFVKVPYSGGSFRLEFDWLPTNTNWAGNLRLGLWGSAMRANAASSVYANYNLDTNGYHLLTEAYWPGGSTAADAGSFSDGQWYHSTIAYSEALHTITVTVVRASDGLTMGATAHNVGQFTGMDRIALTSIGDDAYPDSTAEGFIVNVRLVGGDRVVFDAPADGARFYLAPRSVFPITFHLVDGQGNPVTEQRPVTLEVTEISSPTVTTSYRFSAVDGNLVFGSLRVPWQYTAPLRRATVPQPGGGACTAVVSENGVAIGSISFNISSLYNRPLR